MSTAKLGVHDLTRYILAHDIEAEILHLDMPAPTVEAAAYALNAKPGQIIKSILFVIDARPVLAIACGTAVIERRAIADLFTVGKKRVKLAKADEVLALSGFEVGAMPPFGHLQPLITLIDKRVLDLPEAYAGGGAENALVHLNPLDILRVTGAQVLDLVGNL